MSDLLNQAQQIFPLLKMIVFVFLGLVAVLSLGVVTYIIHTTGGPVLRIVQWLCFHTPGTPPHPLLAGVSHGARLIVWAACLALGFWLLWHYFRG